MPPDSNNPDQHQHWLQNFDDRQTKLIHNCQNYALDPGGLPGHQLMLIIAKMTCLLHQREHLLDNMHQREHPLGTRDSGHRT